MNRQQRRAAERAQNKPPHEPEAQRFRRQVLTYFGVAAECDALSLFASTRDWPVESDGGAGAIARRISVLVAVLAELREHREAGRDIPYQARLYELETTLMNFLPEYRLGVEGSSTRELVTTMLHSACQAGVIDSEFFD